MRRHQLVVLTTLLFCCGCAVHSTRRAALNTTYSETIVTYALVQPSESFGSCAVSVRFRVEGKVTSMCLPDNVHTRNHLRPGECHKVEFVRSDHVTGQLTFLHGLAKPEPLAACVGTETPPPAILRKDHALVLFNLPRKASAKILLLDRYPDPARAALLATDVNRDYFKLNDLQDGIRSGFGLFVPRKLGPVSFGLGFVPARKIGGQPPPASAIFPGNPIASRRNGGVGFQIRW